jgi:hypothetical protein
VCYWTREPLIDLAWEGHAEFEPTGIDLSVDVLGTHDSYESAGISNTCKLVAFDGLNFLDETTVEVLAETV